ncbi:hypothetical protein DMJ13_07415 [halophilic archaeon]|nr:hypothetical protein DMJ13_07415 [halophilic archaeon]
MNTFDPSVVDAGVVVLGYLALLATSGRVVTTALSWADETYGDDVSDEQRDIGVIVGKAENVLLLTFVLVGAYTALAVVFAAKSIVRREDMKNDSLFYLAGTLVNFTYSFVVGLLVTVAATVAG